MYNIHLLSIDVSKPRFVDLSIDKNKLPKTSIGSSIYFSYVCFRTIYYILIIKLYHIIVIYGRCIF